MGTDTIYGTFTRKRDSKNREAEGNHLLFSHTFI